MTVRIGRSPDRPWTLSLRVPAWTEGATTLLVEPDGRRRAVAPGTATVTRLFRPGDEIRLELPMAPRWMAPDPRIDAVRGTASVQRGPLVYCVESVDLPGGQEVDAVRVDPSVEPQDAPDAQGTVVAGELAAHGERGDAPWPYAQLHRRPTAATADGEEIVQMPYHSWANRGPSTMRVWLPTAEPDRGNPTRGV